MTAARSSDVWIGVALLALLLWWLLGGSRASDGGRIPESSDGEFFLEDTNGTPPPGDGDGFFPAGSSDEFPDPPFPPGPPGGALPEPAPEGPSGGGTFASSGAPHPGLPTPPPPTPDRFPGASATTSPSSTSGTPGPRPPNPPAPPPTAPPAPFARRNPEPTIAALAIPHPGLPEPPPFFAPTPASTSSSTRTTTSSSTPPAPATALRRPDLSQSPFARRDRITTSEPFEVVVDVARPPTHTPNLDPAAPPSRIEGATLVAISLLGAGAAAAPKVAQAGRVIAPHAAAAGRAVAATADRAAAAARAALPAAVGGGGSRFAQTTAANFARTIPQSLGGRAALALGLGGTALAAKDAIEKHAETGLTSSERRVAAHRPVVDFLAPLRNAVADATRRAAAAPAPPPLPAAGPDLPVPEEPAEAGLPPLPEEKPK